MRTSKLCDEDEPVQLSLFDIIGTSYDIKNPPGNAHANAKVVCRQGDAFAAQNFAERNSFDTNWKKDEKHRKVERALGEIRRKFGEEAVVRGGLPYKEGNREKNK